MITLVFTASTATTTKLLRVCVGSFIRVKKRRKKKICDNRQLSLLNWRQHRCGIVSYLYRRGKESFADCSDIPNGTKARKNAICFCRYIFLRLDILSITAAVLKNCFFFCFHIVRTG